MPAQRISRDFPNFAVRLPVMWPPPDPDVTSDLFRTALRAASRVLSPSLAGNRLDDVVSQAVYEYWEMIERGEVIENPEAMVTTIAQRRALDERRKWERRRHNPLDDLTDSDDRTVIRPEVIARLRSDLPTTLTLREKVAGLIKSKGGDEIDVQLAIRVWFDDASHEELANDFGLTEKTIQNRLSMTRKRLEEGLLGGTDLL